MTDFILNRLKLISLVVLLVPFLACSAVPDLTRKSPPPNECQGACRAPETGRWRSAGAAGEPAGAGLAADKAGT
ncbi:MAG: hypothetical protein LBS31_09325, partial [Candidatus Adiutrix sp.]|nr:hypothetical protein [Candidatus Adiutrix sp.]